MWKSIPTIRFPRVWGSKHVSPGSTNFLWKGYKIWFLNSMNLEWLKFYQFTPDFKSFFKNPFLEMFKVFNKSPLDNMSFMEIPSLQAKASALRIFLKWRMFIEPRLLCYRILGFQCHLKDCHSDDLHTARSSEDLPHLTLSMSSNMIIFLRVVFIIPAGDGGNQLFSQFDYFLFST